MTHDHDFTKDLDGQVTCSICGAMDDEKELHKPMLWKNLGNDTDGYKCQVCEGNSYPCPTVQAIEKELA